MLYVLINPQFSYNPEIQNWLAVSTPLKECQLGLLFQMQPDKNVPNHELKTKSQIPFKSHLATIFQWFSWGFPMDFHRFTIAFQAIASDRATRKRLMPESRKTSACSNERRGEDKGVRMVSGNSSMYVYIYICICICICI